MTLPVVTCPGCDGQQAFTHERCGGGGCYSCVDGEVFCQTCVGQGSVVMPALCPNCHVYHGGDLVYDLKPVSELCVICEPETPNAAPRVAGAPSPWDLSGRGQLSPKSGVVPPADSKPKVVSSASTPKPGGVPPAASQFSSEPEGGREKPPPSGSSLADSARVDAVRAMRLDRWRRRGSKAKPCYHGCGTDVVAANEADGDGGHDLVFTDSNGRSHACPPKAP